MADNIIVSLPSTYSQTSYDSYKSSLNLVLSLHIICICFNLAGLLQLPTESDRLGDILVPQVSCLGSRCSFHRTRSLSSSLIQLDAFTLVWPSWKHGRCHQLLFCNDTSSRHYLNFWYIWAFFSAPVAFIEACIVIGTFSLGSLNIT
mmetsp:Transcript_52655/g.163413  ORF Transcript_52655/g.163413 Transcript_52655/m.163413 type:complete len:147 (+) Transcript_52655:250-690(+)